MKGLELTKEELRLITNALNYVGNQYLDQVRQLVTLDRSFKNTEILNRSEKYHALAAKITGAES